MATFEAALTSCGEITAFLDAFYGQEERELGVARSREMQQNQAYRTACTGCTERHNSLTVENKQKKKDRTARAEECLTAARDLLDQEINDPHWFRMRKHYYEKTRGYADARQYRSIPPKKLIRGLEKTYLKLQKEVGLLRNAFMPPAGSKVIGKVLPSFRKERYTRIAMLRNTLLGMAVALCNNGDLESRQAKMDGAFSRAQQVLRQEHLSKLRQLRAEARAGMASRREQASHLLQNSAPFATLSRKEPLSIGRYIYPGGQGARLSEGQRPLLSLAVTCSGFEGSILLKQRNKAPLTGFYTGLILELLDRDPDARIAVIDVKGLGRDYAPLAELAGVSGFRVWSTADQVQAFLESVERDIAAAYSGERTGSKIYILVDDCTRNIPDRCMESFGRIVSNGGEGGVYVIASLKDTGQISRQWSAAFAEMNVRQYEVHDGKIVVGNGSIALAAVKNPTERVPLTAERLARRSQNAEVIPLWSALPHAADWRKKNSANGIRIPFGKNLRTGAPEYFSLTEDKPYALVIGDVDAGKSSSLHCLMLQMMANYGPSELRIAIGDFKNGCEFDLYVRNRLPSVDAVVNSQDPDTMSSFLGYYVAEMGRRQALFNATAQRCGRMIRKYETYRRACSEGGLAYLPRLCLIVDEFQTLFDSPLAGTASLLSELVRKGRTYGIHIIMASQRAISDNPRSGFSSELKNYFTTRMVFRSPQQAARSMLSERCADTGRENSGIAEAALLKKGHCVFNTYMGQKEGDNRTVQCYYASDQGIERAIRVLQKLDGASRNGVLLSQDARSVPAPSAVKGFALLGASVRLRHDEACPNEDVFRDNSVVGIDLHKLRTNLAVVSDDPRVHLASLRALMEGIPPDAKVNLCGDGNTPLAKAFLGEYGDRLIHRERPVEPLAEKTDTVNLILEPEREAAYSQANSYRRTEAVEQLEGVLELPAGGRVINVLFVSSFKAFKTNLPYAVAKVPLRIVGVGDRENLRLAINEGMGAGQSAFDTPSRRAIKAYYHNHTTGKTGKIIMFCKNP